MAHTVFCVRYKKEMEGLDEPPFDSDFGQKIYKNVSKAAWGEWVDQQKMLLNEYRLQPWTPQAQQFLVEQMEQFFFGEGSGCPRSTFHRRTERQGSGSIGCRWPVQIPGEPRSDSPVRHERARLGSCKLRKTPKPAPEPARLCRDVAQPGRALAWGARGWQFKSARPDHFI